MFQLPPVPSWDGLHPLIIHFPIALLVIAPVFVVIGAVVGPQKGRPYLLAALVLMLVGTATVFVAVETGEAAGKLAERSPEINAALERHEALAERTRVWFSLLTTMFAFIAGLTMLGPWKTSRISMTALPLAFLLIYGAGTVSLVNTAHQGGTLVHQFGVHAMVTPSAAPATPDQTHREAGGE